MFYDKKHVKEIVIWTLIPVFVVLALLRMVYVFEIRDIHVPESWEMWIGLIGAVLGGMFTMIGVLVTVYKQEMQNEESNRLENMPILAFIIIELDRIEVDDEHIINDETMYDGTLACFKGEFCTSDFQFIEEKICKAIEISVLNNACVFDFTIEGCLINGKEIYQGNAFNPAMRRMVSGEKYRLIFDDGDYSNRNEFCLIRFSHKDILGNKYYQDLPIEYVEIESDDIIEQSIEIRDIKAPIFVADEDKSLEEVAKEYCDYKVFC